MYDAFTGKALYNPLDSTMAKLMKVSGKLTENILLPGYLTSSGALGKALAVAASTEYADRKDLSWRDVWLAMLGINTQPLSPAFMQRLLAVGKRFNNEVWGAYKATTTDDDETFAANQQEHREVMFLLEHPDARKPDGVDPQKYTEATQIGPETGGLTDEMKMQLLSDKANFDKFLYNLPIEKINKNSKKTLAK